MSPEELMQPRYKVIADWPGNGMWAVGRILNLFDFDKGISLKKWKAYFAQYPHLFKPLEWWEDRAVEDMPEYVKAGERANDNIETNWVGRWIGPVKSNGWGATSYGENYALYMQWIEPATLEEYTAYQSLPNQQ